MKKIAIIGGGVIGGGWAARFLLHGHDVTVFDTHPDARRLVNEVLANATRAYGRMMTVPLGEPGRLNWADNLADAVRGADYIQESVPERLDLKHRVFAEIEVAARPDTIIGSSTSGFKPSELRQGAKHPGRIFVAHPFNPVYLLPIVEIVGAEGSTPAALSGIETLLADVGMKPITLGQEIDAHIGDRLLEALWREALWLVKDGIATTGEIDDVIRFGFGLRWAQMGIFETYRIAGGEAGMRHFLAQFGPALKWPWTKLIDVPDLDEALIDRIANQSDAQSGARGIRELERIRDDNLIGIMQALRVQDWGAGQSLQKIEDHFRNRNATTPVPPATAAGSQTYHGKVRPDWVDYNGHMTEYRYLQVFGDATDVFLLQVGMDETYRAGGHSIYTVETHIRHLHEVAAGETVTVLTRLLEQDTKRIRILHQMQASDGIVLATGEHMLLHVDTSAAAAAPMLPKLAAGLAQFAAKQVTAPLPDYAGQGIRRIPQPKVQ